ncbi:MAG: hypothetical protein ACOVO5_13345 [Devosia sp.]|jgi:hypothetical protein|uniref:hypothetical protein n=1 Tax=Devosia sp. TaxID=1871048 RepID=UPI0037BEB0C4
MTQFRTIDLPRTAYSGGARPSLRRYGPPAELLSQMLQQRHRAAPIAGRGKETIATDAYEAQARAGVLRMPAGYRRTIVA